MLPASQSLYMYMYTMYLAYILGLSNVIQFYTLGYIVQTLWDNYVFAKMRPTMRPQKSFYKKKH